MKKQQQTNRKLGTRVTSDTGVIRCVCLRFSVRYSRHSMLDVCVYIVYKHRAISFGDYSGRVIIFWKSSSHRAISTTSAQKSLEASEVDLRRSHGDCTLNFVWKTCWLPRGLQRSGVVGIATTSYMMSRHTPGTSNNMVLCGSEAERLTVVGVTSAKEPQPGND